MELLTKFMGLLMGNMTKHSKLMGGKLWITTSLNTTISGFSGKKLWEIESEASGILEARFSYDDIKNHFVNMNSYYFHDSEYKMPEYLTKWFWEQRKWMEGMLEQFTDDPYYIQIKCQHLQLLGMINEYNKIAKEKGENEIRYEHFHVMETFGI